MSFNHTARQLVSIVATAGGKADSLGSKFVGSEGFKANAVGPVNGTVALGLDDGLLGSPGDDMGHEVVSSDELLFIGVEELRAHPQHLLAIC